MVAEDLYFDGEKYLSVRSASKITKYAADYIGQLCRAGKLRARRVGRGWYIEEKSLSEHLSAYSALSKNHEFRNQKTAEAPSVQPHSEIGRELMRREIDARVSEEIKSLSKPVIESVPSPVLPELKKKPEEKKEPLIFRSATPGGFSLAERKESNKEKSNEVIKKSERGFKRNEENSLHSLIPSFLPSPNKIAALTLSVGIVFFGYQLEVNQVHLADVARLPVSVVTEISKSMQDMRGAEMRALSIASAGDGIVEIIRRAGEKIADRLFGDFGYTLVVTAPDEEKNQALLSEIEGLKKRLASFERAGGTLASGGSAPAVIERVVSVVSGVSETDLNVLENSLKSELYRVAAVSASANNATYQAVALTNRIDKLFNTAISGATITNSTFAGSIAATSLSASGDGSVGGALTVTSTITSSSGTSTLKRLVISGLDCSALANAGKLTVTSAGAVVCQDDLGGGGGSDFTYSSVEPNNSFGIVYMATTSNQLLLGMTASSTAARLEVSGGIFVTGASSTIQNISSTNSTTTNATTTNLAVSGTASTSVLIVSNDATIGGTLNVAGAAVFSSTFSAGTTTLTNLAVTNTSTSTFAGPVASAAGNLILASAGTTNNLLLNPYGGNVGIGTRSPFARLHVKQSNELTINSGMRVERESNDSSLFLSYVSSTDNWQIAAAFGSSGAYKPIGIYTSGAERISVATSGNVGIGTTSPYQKLSVAGNVIADSFIATSTTATSTIAGFLDVSGTGTNATSTFASNLWVKGTLQAGTGSSYLSDAGLNISGSGKVVVPNGTAAAPTIVFSSSPTTGFYADSSNQITTSISGAKHTLWYAGNQIGYVAGENSTGFRIASQKSRGSVTFPTTITTGDNLLTFSGYGYVGSSNTYQEAAQILFDSTGTISDSATGIAGTIRFLTADTGSEPAERLTISNSGNVGIGTTSPWGQLSVNPNGITGSAFVVGSSTATKFIVTNGGNVGIGTTSPYAPLSISSGTVARAFVVGRAADKTEFFVVDAANNRVLIDPNAAVNMTFGISSTSPTSKLSISNTSNITAFSLTNTGTSYTAYIEDAPNDTSPFVIDTSGNVGIGTTTPMEKLSVNGALASYAPSAGFPGTSLAALILDANVTVTGGDTNAARVVSTGANSALTFWTANSEKMRISSTGNVGIGTTSPYAKLSVVGETVAPLFTATTTGFRGPAGSVSAPTYSFSDDTDTGIYYPTTNTIGIAISGGSRQRFTTSNAIGFTSFTEDGDVFPDSTNTNIGASVSSNVRVASEIAPFRAVISGTTDPVVGALSILRARGTGSSPSAITSGDNLGSIAAYGYVGATNDYQEAAQILFDSTGTISDSATGIAGTIRFLTADTGSEPAERLTISNSGNVGIGTTTPGAKLNIIGALCVDDSTPTCGNAARTDGTVYAVNAFSASLDLAEAYPTKDATLEAGEIVMIDTGNSVFVSRADRATSSPVLGIVSTKPGFYLGGFNDELYAEERKVPVALSGRVPTRVSTEGGAIVKGDRIALSSAPGIGMKATGTRPTVGIALEDFDGTGGENIVVGGSIYSKGSILVFVNLGGGTLDRDISAAAQASTSTPWMVDQQGGLTSVNFFGDINLQGNRLLDVSRISGYMGKWSIDEEGRFMGDSIEVRGTVKVGSPERRTGVTLFDEVTGDPYCLSLAAGAVKTVVGECSSAGVSGGASSSSAPAEETPATPTSDVATSTPPVDEGTTEPAAEGSTATSTEPISP